MTFEFWHGADAELPTWLLELGNFAPENLGSSLVGRHLVEDFLEDLKLETYEIFMRLRLIKTFDYI